MLGKKINKHRHFRHFTVKTVKTFAINCFELYMYELGLGGIYYLRFSLSIVLLTGSIDALYG